MNKTLTNMQIKSISPIDGRYFNKTEKLQGFFSEYALIKYRLFVEIEYLIYLSTVLNLNIDSNIRTIFINFNTSDADRIKEIESICNHDVKAIEYFLKEKLQALGYTNTEFVHFGLTSQDINNTAIPLLLKDWYLNEYLNDIYQILDTLSKLAHKHRDVVMLAHTHGQPASPTKLGKEIMVFVERIKNQLDPNFKFYSKFGGATGNLNAHKVAYPNIDWVANFNTFISNLGLIRQENTTQIEHYDSIAALFHMLERINTILIDFCQDVWLYVSMEYFKQRVIKNEVGSSAMPHKVNPIDFENAEGNLQLANALYSFMAKKLPISRLQRDLTDSTVLRNIGVPIAHTHISLQSIQKGIGKLEVNFDKINQDLEDNWIVVSEAIQTVLRSIGYENPYEELKALTRHNTKVGKTEIHAFIDSLKIEDSYKERLKKITPHNYV